MTEFRFNFQETRRPPKRKKSCETLPAREQSMEHHVDIMTMAPASTLMMRERSLKLSRKLKRSPEQSQKLMMLQKAVEKENAVKAQMTLVLRKISRKYRVSTSRKDIAIKETSAVISTRLSQMSQTLRYHLHLLPPVRVLAV